MSTFSGRMGEYPLLSIDRFDGLNLDSSAYFLSHNHTDHTVGLNQQFFRYRVSTNSKIKLYCSKITRDLLLLEEQYKALEKSIVGLEVDEPQQISIPDPQTWKTKDEVTVTLLHAQHCPGSVMFLFEGSAGNVLYTGDFRLIISDLKMMHHLHSGSVPKEIKSLYVDTTFCVPHALYIPTREEASSAAIGIVKEWITQGKDHIVVLRYKANLGYENLFKTLSECFDMKVHVGSSKYAQYQKVGDMADYTTPDPTSTQIHACKWVSDRAEGSQLPCGYKPEASQLHVRYIKVSTMVFVERVGTHVFAKQRSSRFYQVCYSFHSSYSEIRDLVTYLKPHQAFPNVIPLKDSMEKVQQRLNQFVEVGKNSILRTAGNEYKALGKLKAGKRRKRAILKKDSQKSHLSSDLNFGDIGDSPAKPKRMKTDDKSSPADSGFHLLHGDVGSDVEPEPSSQEEQNKDSEEAYSSEEEMKTGAESDDEDDIDLRLSLSQEDKDTLEHFKPLMPETYGSVLGYISSEDENEDELQNLHLLDDIEKVPSVELNVQNQESISPKDGSTSNQLLDTAISASENGLNFTNSVSFGSSFITVGDKEAESKGGIESLTKEQRARNEAKFHELMKDFQPSSSSSSPFLRDGKRRSGEVIDLVDEEEERVRKKQNASSPEKADDPSTSSQSTVEVSPEKEKDSSENTNNVPKASETGPMCTIDLTEMDEDEEVYPSTSGRAAGYDNIFSRFGHHGIQAYDEDEVEYYEKEVECSDDECECGGKAKGGTHKYMVSRPKKKATAPAPLVPQVAWAAEDDSSLAQARTRKWIESQSLYVQRQNMLNSHTVSSSEVIVIDSDDDDDEEEVNNSVNGIKVTAENGDITGHKSPERDTTGKDPNASPVTDQSPSLTSCPTNISMQANASEPSQKSNALGAQGQNQWLVNGNKSDQVDTNDSTRLSAEPTVHKDTES